MGSQNPINLKVATIIPFDIGIDVDDAIVREITKKFEKVSTEEEFLLEGRVAKIERKTEGALLEIDLFKDGTGIVSFVEETFLDSIEKFDPFQFLQQRAQVHHTILKHEHPCSGAMDKILEELRKISKRSAELKSNHKGRKVRFTASPDWEKKGLSYVMSVYFIHMPELSSKLRDATEKELRRKFASFMEPSVYRAEDTFAKAEVPVFKPQTAFVDEAYLDEISDRVFAIDYDMDPSISAYMTWSNVIVVGDINDFVVNEYLTLQKKLQHVWFYSYVTDKVVKEALAKFEERRSVVDIDYLDNLRSKILLRIDEFTNIQESTTGSRYFRLFEGLMKTSQLDRLISSLEKKVQLLGMRIEREDAKNRQRAQRRIELVLFVLTYLSGVSSVLTVLDLTNIYLAILLTIPLIPVILYLHDP